VLFLAVAGFFVWVSVSLPSVYGIRGANAERIYFGACVIFTRVRGATRGHPSLIFS
jgi:hypothetical protein